MDENGREACGRLEGIALAMPRRVVDLRPRKRRRASLQEEQARAASVKVVPRIARTMLRTASARVDGPAE